MADASRRILAFEAAASNGYDGVIRLLVDAERFGLELQSLAVSWPGAGVAKIEFTLAVDESVDAVNLVQRFARHPTLSFVEHAAKASTFNS
jgi:hypothetical protein